MDGDSLISVAEDLEYLRDEWGPDTVAPAIRRGSATLRRLLVEDAYGGAWRAVGFVGQPTLVAVELEKFVRDDQLPLVDIAMAWGARMGGAFMAAPLIFGVQTDVDKSRVNEPLSKEGYPGERVYTLSEFLGSASGIMKGKSITRRDVIKYVANVRGGVHLSQKRKAAERDLVARVGKYEKRMNMTGRDGILVEIVAIAQAVGRSSDAMSLIEKIRLVAAR